MYLAYLLAPLSIIIVAYSIFYFEFYRDWTYACVGKIKFESFKAFYAMNPEQWSLWDGYVEYTKYTYNGPFYDNYISGRLGFNQIDALKYQHWHKKLDKQKEQENTNNQFKEILNALQDDINMYKERNNVS